MSDLQDLAAACHEDNREKAGQLFTDFAMFPRLDTSSRLALIAWGLIQRINSTRPVRRETPASCEGAAPGTLTP